MMDFQYSIVSLFFVYNLQYQSIRYRVHMMISKVFFINSVKENAIINILKFIIKISDPFVTFGPLCMKTDFQRGKKGSKYFSPEHKRLMTFSAFI